MPCYLNGKSSQQIPSVSIKGVYSTARNTIPIHKAPHYVSLCQQNKISKSLSNGSCQCFTWKISSWDVISSTSSFNLIQKQGNSALNLKPKKERKTQKNCFRCCKQHAWHNSHDTYRVFLSSRCSASSLVWRAHPSTLHFCNCIEFVSWFMFFQEYTTFAEVTICRIVDLTVAKVGLNR